MDEERLAQDIPDDPRDGLHRVIRLAELDQPRGGAARSGQLELVAVEPDHEELRLYRAFDIEAVRKSRHSAHRTPPPAGSRRQTIPAGLAAMRSDPAG